MVFSHFIMNEAERIGFYDTATFSILLAKKQDNWTQTPTNTQGSFIHTLWKKMVGEILKLFHLFNRIGCG